MKLSIFHSCLVLMYLIGACMFIAVAWYGWGYYTLPLADRPMTELHDLLKPGGIIGHGLGIVGSAMILLLFVYSARKREKFGLRIGKMNNWLDIHIWFGIIGPLLITLHTAMKFSGIVSISYFSMIAVMLSGFAGRYIYKRLPRDEEGSMLSLRELDITIDGLNIFLADEYMVPKNILANINRSVGIVSPGSQRGFIPFLGYVTSDFLRPFRIARIKRFIRKNHPEIPPKATEQILSVAKERAELIRKRAAIDNLRQAFHYWHVIHKPFAIVMIVIMFLHILLVTLMGNNWIF